MDYYDGALVGGTSGTPSVMWTSVVENLWGGGRRSFIAVQRGREKLKIKFPRPYKPAPWQDCRTKEWEAGTKQIEADLKRRLAIYENARTVMALGRRKIPT